MTAQPSTPSEAASTTDTSQRGLRDDEHKDKGSNTGPRTRTYASQSERDLKDNSNTNDKCSSSGALAGDEQAVGDHKDAAEVGSDGGSGDEKEMSGDVVVGKESNVRRRSARKSKVYGIQQVLYIQMEYCEKTLSDVINEVRTDSCVVTTFFCMCHCDM